MCIDSVGCLFAMGRRLKAFLDLYKEDRDEASVNVFIARAS